MRRGFSRLVLGVALSAAVLVGTGGEALARVPQTPGPEPGSPEQMEYFADFCRHELQRPPTAAPHVGKADNVTSPGPGVALAGDVIDITISWDPADFDDTWIQKVLNCVAIDGVPVPQLTDEERPAPNDGSYNRELVIPADIEGGRLLCQQGFVYGNLSRGGYSLISSPRVCFTTEAAAPPPPPPPPPPPTTTTTEPPTTTTTAAPLPARVAAEAPTPPPAPAPVPVKTLPRTGPHDRLLLLGAGAALAMGGLGVAAGARRKRAALR